MVEKDRYVDMRTERLERLHGVIERNVKYVDIRPYSHNLIGLALSEIAALCGQEEANKCITEFKLEKLGWSKVKQEERCDKK